MTTKTNPRRILGITFFGIVAILFTFVLTGCGFEESGTQVAINKAAPTIVMNADGTTLEQDNIRAYRSAFSDPKSIKFLYVFNDQGSCIFFDTVQGKVTSGGKRLRPKTIMNGNGTMGVFNGIKVTIDGRAYITGEVPAFDRTFGSSEAYIYWRNTVGQFRKLSLGAGMSVITTTSPMRLIKAVVDISEVTAPVEGK